MALNIDFKDLFVLFKCLFMPLYERILSGADTYNEIYLT